ncbi:MAG: molybdopterin cofactor-binding domain-containing protein [Gammaproteobacteria bacterium]
MADFTLTRRALLRGGSALCVGLMLAPKGAIAKTAPKSFTPNAMLTIAPDNTVRITMAHAEMGQGAYTGMAQILADELDANWDDVIAEHLASLDPAFKHRDWGMISTGASTSITSQWNHLREVGATARAMLLEAAAEQWGVDATALHTANSKVIDPGNNRELSYGELTARAAGLEPPQNVTLKSPDQFTLIGRNVGRVDSHVKSSGSATFGMDLILPDMLMAAVAHAPVFGATVKSFDATAAEAMPGVRKVVRIATGVAVIADSWWQATQAKDVLDISWENDDFANTSSADLWQTYSRLADGRGATFDKVGNVELPESARVIEGEIRFPFLAHAPMEPLNATVQIRDKFCEIWAGTQFQDFDALNLEQFAGVDPKQIKINTQWLGGSFGRRASPDGDFLVEAVQIAKASGLANPIKMIWQREDDIRGGFYRPMVLHRYQIGLDDQNRPQHWEHRVVSASISKGTPFEGAFVKDGIDQLSVEGLRHTKYNVPNKHFSLHTPKHAVKVLWWRSEADSHTGPAVEILMNRLARAAGEDPITFRLQLLEGNTEAHRMVGVLKALRTASGWMAKPEPDVFRGVAVHESFGSVAGYVVELKRRDKRLEFNRVVAAMDCGRVVNPESVKSQIYGSAAFALSTVIGQKLEIREGGAAQSNFHDHLVARLAHTPEVEVTLVDNGLDRPTGVGEVGVPPFIPALTEAVYQATGQEIDAFPMALADGFSLAAG